MFKPLALVAAVSAVFSLQASAAGTQLTVYTALEAEQLKSYKQAFEKANPDIEIKWVRDSTGIITAKLLAEKTARRQTRCGAWLPPAWPSSTRTACSKPTRPKTWARSPQLPRRRQPACLGRHGRLGCHPLLQHRRGREAGPEQAGELAGPDQA